MRVMMRAALLGCMWMACADAGNRFVSPLEAGPHQPEHWVVDFTPGATADEEAAVIAALRAAGAADAEVLRVGSWHVATAELDEVTARAISEYPGVEAVEPDVELGVEACQDFSRSDGSQWYPSWQAWLGCNSITADTCSTWARPSKADDEGVHAGQACCVCGGGHRWGESTPAATPTPPTPVPTEAPTPEPTEAPTPEPTEAPTPEPTEALSSGCSDKTVDGAPWHGRWGSKYSCTWFAGSDTRCSKYGHIGANDGMVANDACCVCGGGSSGALPVTSAPPTPAPTTSAPPTPAPPATGGDKVCIDLVQSNGAPWVSSIGWYCSTYTQATCSIFPDGQNGMLAARACCVCGGGRMGVAATPAAAKPPTPSPPTPSPPTPAPKPVPRPTGSPLSALLLPQCPLAQTNGNWGQDAITGVKGKFLYGTDYGAGVDVYVLDTGIDCSHSEFKGRCEWSFTTPGSQAEDTHGHGTHVAGIAAGTRFGVAKAARVLAVKVVPDDLGTSTLSRVIPGLAHVIDAAKASGRPSVINMSLGRKTSATQLDRASRAAVEAGITVVTSSGNDGGNACDNSPARVESLITVGMTNSLGYRHSGSNYGSCVDIMAPGADIPAAGIHSQWTRKTGTSMASPMVAGAAAVVLARNPTSTPAEVKAWLVQNAAKPEKLHGNSPDTFLQIPCVE
eukprot:TRINITY_DN221_c0_g2_i3.p1 TRINITY_DN221_c0_g2~~TRINITY_DN221_c0_g2_i3.p1  ORF type:complete len:678 (+),score=169.75 TRINITY_DN221_c0_g2_i3:75-2108(+)